MNAEPAAQLGLLYLNSTGAGQRSDRRPSVVRPSSDELPDWCSEFMGGDETKARLGSETTFPAASEFVAEGAGPIRIGPIGDHLELGISGRLNRRASGTHRRSAFQSLRRDENVVHHGGMQLSVAGTPRDHHRNPVRVLWLADEGVCLGDGWSQGLFSWYRSSQSATRQGARAREGTNRPLSHIATTP